MADTYTRYDITTLPDSKAHIRMTTNDDNDDGYPDGQDVSWERDTAMQTAMKVAGYRSHTGYYGQPVDVYLDGKRI